MTLSSKPLYEDDTLVLVAAMVGMAVGACLLVCVCDCCLKCRPCILLLTCKCMSYEAGHLQPAPFDVSHAKKRALKKQQRGVDQHTTWWA